MKYLVALAMLSVALAAEIRPITLPKAPLPVVETYVPQFEPVDISPAFVPAEVMEALRLAELNQPEFAVHVVEFYEEVPEIKSQDLPEFSGVRVVDALPELAEVAEQYEIEDIVPEPVKFVEVAEILEDINAVDGQVDEIPAVAVKFVDVAPEVYDAPVEEAALLAEDAPVDAVKVVEFAPEAEESAVAYDIAADAVNFVDVAPEVYDAPVEEAAPLADDAPVDAVKVVEFAAEAEEVAPLADDAPVVPVKVVDVAPEVYETPVDFPLDDAPVEGVKVVHYPGKVFADPLLR